MKNEIQIYRIFLCILIALLVIVSHKYYKLKTNKVKMEFETEIEKAEVTISFDFQPEEKGGVRRPAAGRGGAAGARGPDGVDDAEPGGPAGHARGSKRGQ